MKLIWHMAKKDLRRLAPVAIGWIIAEIVFGAFVLWGQHGDIESARLVAKLAPYNGLQWEILVTVFVTAFYVVVLMRGDRVAGTDMFWATRPVSPGMLLTAKLIAVGVLAIALPIFVHFVWWWYHGLTLGQMFMLGWPVVLRQAVVVAVVFILCVLFTAKSRGGNPLLGFLLLLISLMTVVPVLISLRSPGVMFEPTVPRVLYSSKAISMELACTRVFLAHVLIFLSVCVVAWHQFWKRRPDISMGLWGGGMVLVLLVLFRWPVVVPVVAGYGSNVAPTLGSLGGKMRVQAVRGQEVIERRRGLRDYCIVEAVISGDLAGKRLSVDYVDGVVEFPEESFKVTGGGGDTGVISQLVSKSRIQDERRIQLMVFPINEGTQLERWKKRVAAKEWKDAKLRFSVRGRLHDFEGICEISLTPGSRAVLAGTSVSYLGVRGTGKDTRHAVLETTMSRQTLRGEYQIGPAGLSATPAKIGIDHSLMEYVHRADVWFSHLGIVAYQNEQARKATKGGVERKNTVEGISSLYRPVYSLPTYWQGKLE